jgi:hypothetical protein
MRLASVCTGEGGVHFASVMTRDGDEIDTHLREG